MPRIFRDPRLKKKTIDFLSNFFHVNHVRSMLTSVFSVHPFFFQILFPTSIYFPNEPNCVSTTAIILYCPTVSLMFYSRLATPLCHLFLWLLFSFTHNIEFAEPGNYHIVKISLISSNIYYAMCSWIAWTCEEKNIVLRHSFVFKINKLKNKLCYFIFCEVRTEIITHHLFYKVFS